MKNKILIFVFFLVFLTGCARCTLVRSEYYDLTGKVVIAKDENREIPVLTAAPDKPYEEIGVVKVMARWETSQEMINKEIVRRARGAGADAVMNIEYGEDRENKIPLCGKIVSTKRNKTARGTAIVFKPASENAPAPAAS